MHSSDEIGFEGWSGTPRTARSSTAAVLLGLCVLVVAPAGAQSVEWALRTDSGPAPRRSHAMAYDSVRGVVVLFGGWGNGHHMGDTWEWTGTSWTERSVSGPAPRDGHQMAFDSTRGVTVLFGGVIGAPSPWSGETWEWDGVAWSLRSTGGPSPRTDAAIAFDSQRGVTVLFGGLGGGQSWDDTWEWNGVSWTHRLVSGPSRREYHAMAYDADRGVTVLFGGITNTLNGETWEWNGSSWTQRLVPGPSPRDAHTMSFDVGRGVTVLFGGNAGAGQDIWNGETWEWDGVAWYQRPGSGPSGRYDPEMVFDFARSVTVLFGGDAGFPDYESGETWERGAPGIMAVTPGGGLDAEGVAGGPFSPAARLYDLTNTGSLPISWAATKTQAWVTLSPTGGTINAGATVAVDISINAQANALSAGSYSDTVTFTNTTNGTGNTTRPVALTVLVPAVLAVTPADGLDSSGYVGGPFAPSFQTYTLMNTGGASLNWAATRTQEWVTVSSPSGTLGAGASTDVTVSINAAANSFAEGNYTDTVTFTNATNGSGSTTRPVTLSVRRCLGDIAGTGDGEVGLNDLSLLLSDFGCSAECGASDLDGDGDVDISDLSLLLSLFGTTCP